MTFACRIEIPNMVQNLIIVIQSPELGIVDTTCTLENLWCRLTMCFYHSFLDAKARAKA